MNCFVHKNFICTSFFFLFQTYLNNLTQKTQKPRSVNFEEYGDLSISSGADGRNSLASQGRRSASSAHAPAPSKFLKKKIHENLGNSSYSREYYYNTLLIIESLKILRAKVQLSALHLWWLKLRKFSPKSVMSISSTSTIINKSVVSISKINV